MYLVTIGWLYVVLMAAIVEALSSEGSVLGAVFTFLLWGVLPLSIVLYLMHAPARRRARRAQAALEAARESAGSAPLDPDGGGHPAGDAVAAVRKEP
jgi:predicted membrane channel-forming protein YqfA (hemolysin III family)